MSHRKRVLASSSLRFLSISTYNTNFTHETNDNRVECFASLCFPRSPHAQSRSSITLRRYKVFGFDAVALRPCLSYPSRHNSRMASINVVALINRSIVAPIGAVPLEEIGNCDKHTVHTISGAGCQSHGSMGIARALRHS